MLPFTVVVALIDDETERYATTSIHHIYADTPDKAVAAAADMAAIYDCGRGYGFDLSRADYDVVACFEGFTPNRVAPRNAAGVAA